MEATPWSGESNVQENPDHPAVYISWEDVQSFIGKLNQSEGSQAYRLPTEAEWEYACRAGTTTRWSFGDDESRLKDYAWYFDNACDIGECYGHVVGTKPPNPWGLYDMHGNVWEWCWDWLGFYWVNLGGWVDPTGPATGSKRVLRGGGFGGGAQSTRSANRGSIAPGDRFSFVGARLVRIGP
jgi:formylglycine-generating enzyme required for sulfatase activity